MNFVADSHFSDVRPFFNLFWNFSSNSILSGDLNITPIVASCSRFSKQVKIPGSKNKN